GGTPLWTEVLETALDDGYFSVELGTLSPLSASLLDNDTLYLGITVGKDAEMEPRSLIRSVPYALVARDVTGDIHPTSVSTNARVVHDVGGRCVAARSGLVGPQGDAGPAGRQGATGPQGIAGPQGATGPQGIAGPQGATGPQGIAGPQGATGPQGIAGPQGAT